MGGVSNCVRVKSTDDEGCLGTPLRLEGSRLRSLGSKQQATSKFLNFSYSCLELEMYTICYMMHTIADAGGRMRTPLVYRYNWMCCIGEDSLRAHMVAVSQDARQSSVRSRQRL